MKHTKKRITKIVDEMITYLFKIGATDINIDLQENVDYYKMSFKSNYTSKDKTKLDKLKKCLKCNKREEVEEYYWELTGQCDVDCQLTLVGMMVDKADINIGEDTIEVILYRNK